MQNIFKKLFFAFHFSLFIFFIAFFVIPVFAWEEPIGQPGESSTLKVITTSVDSQIKEGALTVSTNNTATTKGLIVGNIDSSLSLSATQNLIYGNISSGSAIGSNLILLQNNGVLKFKVDKDGNTVVVGDLTAGKLCIDGQGCKSKWEDIGLPNGTSGQTLRYDSSNNLIANSVLFNNGTNVGIGTTDPGTRKLNVYTNDASNDVGLQAVIARTTGTNYGFSGAASGSGAVNNIGGFFTASGATANYGVRIWNVVSGASNYALYSDSPAQSYFQGNVGIGTTSPDSRLHIKDGQTWGSDLSIDAGGTTGGKRWMAISTGGTAGEGQGKFLIKDSSGGAGVRLTIDTNGNVGIGTTSPSATLTVGNDKFKVAGVTGNITTAGNLTTNGTATSQISGALKVVGDGTDKGLMVGNIDSPFALTGNQNLIYGKILSGVGNANLLLLQNNAGGEFKVDKDGNVTATKFTGSGEGLTSIGKATNLAGGSRGTIPYQSALDTTAMLPVGTDGQFLKSKGAAAPVWDAIPELPTGTSGQTLRYGSDNKLTANSVLTNDGTNINVSGNLTVAGANGIYLTNTGTTGYIKPLASGLGVQITDTSDWDFLVYENQSYLPELYLGYGGSAILRSYDTNENIALMPNGTGNVGIGTTDPGAYRLNVQGDMNVTGKLNVTGAYTVDTVSASMYYDKDNTNYYVNPDGGSTGYSAIFAGNVGIGTTTPNEQLEIANSSVGGRFIVSDGAGADRRVLLLQAPTTSNDYARILAYKYGTGAGGKNLILQDSGGNIGIGTPTPRGHFDVDGSGDIYLTDDTSQPGSQSLFLPGHIYMAPYSNHDIVYLQARRKDNSGTVALRLRTYDAGNLTEAMHITGAGNVGIGTTTPYRKLSVTNTSSGAEMSGMFLQNRAFASNTAISLEFSTTNTDVVTQKITAKRVADGNHALSFSTYGAADAMWIANNGNVGIGTTDPGAYRLNVQGDMNVTGKLNVTGAYTVDTVSASYYLDKDNTNYYIDPNQGTMPYSAIFAGNVGIGTTDPGYKLDVSGDIRATGNVYLGSATAYTAGSNTAQKEKNVSGVTVSGAGWYRVAHIDTAAGRGQNTVTVYTIGGNYATYSTTIRWWHDWDVKAGLTILSETGGGYWNQTRVTDDGTNSYLEIYFTQAITSGLSLSMQYDGGYARGSLYSGTLTAGGGTVRATASTGLLAIGTDKFFVNSTGNVGIGTTGPGAKLHIYSGASGVTGSNAGLILESNTHQYLGFQSAVDTQQGILFGHPGAFNYSAINWEDGSRGNYLSFVINSTQTMALKNGNVGIGTTGPNAKLEVGSSSNTEGVRIISSNYSPFIIRNTADSTDFFRINQDGRLSVNGNSMFYMPSNNPETGPWNPIWNTIGSGKSLYSDEEFASGNNSVGVYNNSNNNAVTITRLTGQTGIPNSTGAVLRVSYDGIGPTNPNFGGVVQNITSVANKTFVQRFRAKVPVGKTLNIDENSQGTNSTSYWLTNNIGTGKWEDYIRVSHTGNTGPFSSGGHISISGGSGAFDWYISSMNVYDVNSPMVSNTWATSGSNIYNINTGNVGIGTTDPGAKLDVAGWVKSKTGYLDRNMLDTTVWTVGSGSVGDFGRNGATTENGRVWDVDPFGRPTLVWKSVNDAESDADGGWHYGSIPIDNNKAYRSTVWIKKVGTTSGYVYLGCDSSNTLNLDNSSNSNPYFHAFGSSNLVSGRWYLFVGYIHAKNDPSTISYSAVYDGVTGKKVFTGTDFKNRNVTNYQVHRTYNYYDTIAGSIQYFWGPRVEELDGNEPSIESLVGVPQGATNDVTAYFGGKVGIGTIAPSSLLSVTPTQYNTGTASQALYAVTGINTAFTAAMVGSQLVYANGVSAGTITAVGSTTSLTVSISQTVSPPQAYNIGYTGLQVASNGNVGIGTTSPSYKLTIGNYNSDNDIIWMQRPDNSQNLDIYAPYGGSGSSYIGYGVQPSSNKWGVWDSTKGWLITADPTTGDVSIPGKLTTGTYETANVSASYYLDKDDPNKYYIDPNGETMTYSAIFAKNVGIGTPTPGTKLHIASDYPVVMGSDGMLKIKSLATTYGSETVSLQTSIDSRTDDYTISGYGGDGRHLLVLQPQGGNVGIGTTVPGAKLHIYSGASGVTGSNAGLILESNTHQYLGFQSAVDTQQGILFGHPGAFNYSAINWEDGSRGNYLSFVVNSTQTMALKNGNVGIGTTNPAGILDVFSTDSTKRIYFTANYAGANQNSDSPKLTFAGKGQTAGVSIQGINTDSYGRKRMAFFTHNADDYTTESEAMSILDNGKVGIGTINPGAYKLNVQGDMNVTGKLNVTGAYTVDTVSASYYLDKDNTNYYIDPNQGTMPYSAIFAGNVGIGTTTPGRKLVIEDNTNPIIRLRDSDHAVGTFWELQQNAFTDDTFGILRYESGSAVSGKSLVITAAGKVGIGNSLPSDTLVIGNNVAAGTRHYMRVFGAAADIYVGQSDGTIAGFGSGNAGFVAQVASKPLAVGTTSTQPLVLFTNNTERLRIDSSTGNVGIGTTDPGVYKLKVQGNAYILDYLDAPGVLHNDHKNTALVDANRKLSDAVANIAPYGYLYSSDLKTVTYTFCPGDGGSDSAPNYGRVPLCTELLTAMYGSVNRYMRGNGDFNIVRITATRAGSAWFLWKDYFSGGSAYLSEWIKVNSGTLNHVAFGNISSTDTPTFKNFKTGYRGADILWDEHKINNMGDSVNYYFALPIFSTAGSTNSGYSIINAPQRFDSQTIFAGNVGIGTTDPGAKLEIRKGAETAGNILLNDATTTDTHFAATVGYVQSAVEGGIVTNAKDCSEDATCEMQGANLNNGSITGVSKLTVATIDPLYEIKGKKYATYVSAIVGGVNEEYIGKAKLKIQNSKFKIYEYVIDFSKEKEGSDLWIWHKAIDFSKDNVDVFITPYGMSANIYYIIEGEKIIFRGDKPAEFSFRLIGKRFDWKKWPTFAKDQNEKAGLIVK